MKHAQSNNGKPAVANARKIKYSSNPQVASAQSLSAESRVMKPHVASCTSGAPWRSSVSLQGVWRGLHIGGRTRLAHKAQSRVLFCSLREGEWHSWLPGPCEGNGKGTATSVEEILPKTQHRMQLESPTTRELLWRGRGGLLGIAARFGPSNLRGRQVCSRVLELIVLIAPLLGLRPGHYSSGVAEGSAQPFGERAVGQVWSSGLWRGDRAQRSPPMLRRAWAARGFWQAPQACTAACA